MLDLSRQQGLSLISLLIGLFISMLCILVGLTLYKNTLTLSTESKIDAQHDGQIAAVLLTLQMELQNAGYGIASAGASDVVFDPFNTTVTNEDGSTRTIINPVIAWRYSSDMGTTFTCRAVKEYSSTDAGISYQTLALATAKTCTASTDLALINWSSNASSDMEEVTIIGRWPVFGELAERLKTQSSLFTFSAPTATTCSPYGALTSTDQHLQVTISALSSATLNAASDAVNHESTFCLLNTYP